MKKSLLALFVLLLWVPVSGISAELANSIADFTTDGTQGVNNWTYGYRDYTTDGGGEDYDVTADFIAFDSATTWDGVKFDLALNAAPWTEISVDGGHPNGTNNVTEEWPIRRWEADALATVTPVGVTWNVTKIAAAGNGVSGSLHVNGVQEDSAATNDAATGVTRTRYINLQPGDFVDLALTPVGPSGDRTDGSDGSLFSMVIDDAVNDVETQPDGRLFIAAGAADTDADGLADAWEELYSPGDLTQLSGLGGADFDTDGLEDLLEQSNSTDPTNADTDGDNLTDFDEFDNHNTDPFLFDTDGDSFGDGDEITGGSDPLDPTSRPVIADSVVEYSGVQGQDGWSYGYRNYSADGGGDDYDPANDFIAFLGGANDPTAFDGVLQQWRGVWDLKNPQNGAGPWTVLEPEVTHPNGTNSAPNQEHWTIRRWTATELPSVTPVALIWLARKNNGVGDGVTGSLHINGTMVDSRTVAGADQTGEERTFYANLSTTDVVDVALSPQGVTTRVDGSDSSVTWLLVSDIIPPNPTQPDGSPFIPATGADGDADNLPDAWEELFFPGDLTQLSGLGGADFDGDGSPDLDEFAELTEPDNVDTDGDGIQDGPETGTGVNNGPMDTGTDPANADTDGDGIDDGAELAAVPATDPNQADTDSDGLSDSDEINIHMTNPTIADTDSDTFDDGFEVSRGLDPLDPNSNPGTLLADSLIDWSGVQGQGNWTYGYRNYTQDGGVDPADGYDPTADFIPFAGGDGLGAWDGVTQVWNGSAWDLNTAAAAPWTVLGSEAVHPNGTNNVDEHWPIRRWTAASLTTTTPLAIRWHTRETNLNGAGVSGGVYVDGVQLDFFSIAGGDAVGVVRTSYANILPGQVVDLVNTPVGPGGDTADGSDGSANWLQIDSYIPPNPTQPDGTPFIASSGLPLAISDVSYDQGTGMLTITWPSAVGRTYAVDSSEGLTPDGFGGFGDWQEIDDGVSGAAMETAFPVSIGVPAPSRFFLRVRDVTGP